MAQAAAAPPFRDGDSYKYQWARYVARKTLDDDLQAFKGLAAKVLEADQARLFLPNIPENADIASIYTDNQDIIGGGIIPPDLKGFKVGIVGAGAAGLFTALIFDWLNEELVKANEDLVIDYDIIEAADEPRLGGRLYTYNFSDKPHDYYDVGAMRFPDNEVMNRTFRLFDYIGLKREIGGLIPYYLDDDKGVCPAYFNDVHTVGDVFGKSGVVDPYKLNGGLPADAKIPERLLEVAPGKLSTEALSTILNHVQGLLDTQRARSAKHVGSSVDDKESDIWETMMKLDRMSVRQFFSSEDNGVDSKGNPLPKGPGYNFNTIEWIEGATFGTGWYNQALSEAVLEELDFDLPKDGSKQFWCIDGGAQKIAELMRAKVKKQSSIRFNSQVTAINANAADRADQKKFVPMTLTVNKTGEKTSTEEKYFAVFNSTTLGALQRMNLKDAGLLWGTKQAIRALGYGASCKVAIKFKTPWWQLPPFNINKGGVSRTDLPLRVCVYPSYNIPDKKVNPNWSADDSSVLLCSYTWAQDAQRIGSLITANSPEGEGQLKNVMFHDLALLHANDEMPYEKVMTLLNEQYDTHHAWDWYKDENMSGAFAYFGPSQFSNMWQEIIKPNAYGQLYLIGEAASAHHAWVVGALESVVRAVYVMFEGLAQGNNYSAYQTVLKLLQNKDSTGLPFYPLPAEMPQRQLETLRSGKVSDDPKKEGDLTYPAAVAMLSQFESLFQDVYEGKLSM